MEPTFRPTPGAKGYQHSCTPVLSSIPLLATLELVDKADFGKMREKGIQLTNTLESLLRQSKYYLGSGSGGSSGSKQQLGFKIITPEAPWRGTQLSLSVIGPDGSMPKVFAHCLKMGLVGDERFPTVIRLSPVVLYNTFQEVGRAADIWDKAFETYEHELGQDSQAQGRADRDVTGSK